MSAYVGSRALERLRAVASPRDLGILRTVSEHRFLSARQIEALLFHEHASGDAGARVCRRVLARLTRDRILIRLQRRVGGVRAGSASFVYAVGPVGWRLLGERKRVTEPSALFLDHTLAIGDVRVLLDQTARTGEFDLAKIEVEPDCWRRFTGPGGARDIVRPDLYVVTASGEYEDAWFLEIDRGTEGPAAIARKCHAYNRYWKSGREQAAHGSFPLTVWISWDERRVRRIERIIGAARNVRRDLFRATTYDGLVELIVGGPA